MELASIPGLMAKGMKEGGRLANNMELVLLFILMELKKLENGTTAKGFAGLMNKLRRLCLLINLEIFIKV